MQLTQIQRVSGNFWKLIRRISDRVTVISKMCWILVVFCPSSVVPLDAFSRHGPSVLSGNATMLSYLHYAILVAIAREHVLGVVLAEEAF